MLDMFKKLLYQFIEESEEESPISYNQAVAALLIEVMLADEEADEREQQQILQAIKKETGLEEVEQMYQEMKAHVEEATDLFQFTKAINEEASNSMKEKLMKSLWRVAFADDVLDEYEDHRIRRISELLYIPHSVFIKTKLAVKDELS